MHKALTAWADKLQHASLPALSQSSERLAQLCADENVNMWNLAHVVERDPGLSIALLRRVNASAGKRLRTEITTVEHAMMLLGLGQMRSLPGAVPVLEKTGEPAARARALRLIARSYHAAHQARELARLRKDLEPDEIFLPALLHHISEILLWLYAPKKMAQIAELVERQSMEPEEAQYVTLGFGLDHMTLELARRWGLPPLLLESLQAENATKPRVLGIMLAVQLARAAEQGWYRHRTTRIIDQIGKHLGYEFGEAAATVHRFSAEAARDSDCFGTPPTAALLLRPSHPEADPEWEPETEPATPTETPAKPKPAQSMAVEEARQPGHAPAFCLIPQLNVLRNTLQELQAGMRQRNLSLQKILSLAMDGMHDGIGLNRVVFALLTQERHQLRARAVAGADNDPVFSRFSIELNGAHLFTRMMEKPQALWINDTNRVKFWPMVPRPFQRTIGCNSFLVLSVFVKGRAVGLFYADRHTPACALDAHAYHRFKQLGMLVAKAMEEVAGS